jgi:hypothetical protein
MRRLLTSPPHVPIEGRQLTSWSVLSDGTQIAIDMVTQDSGTRRIVLPVDSLSALMMTLPRMSQSALDQRFPDGSLRVVQPLGSWHLEQPERGGGLILKLKTNNGYEVAFLLDEGLAGSLGNALLNVPSTTQPDRRN